MAGELTGDPQPGAPVRLTVWVRGHVQGVGFRWWVRSHALELGLAGWASNLADGRVEVVAEGSEQGCDALLRVMRGGSAPGRVSGVTHRWGRSRGLPPGFCER